MPSMILPCGTLESMAPPTPATAAAVPPLAGAATAADAGTVAVDGITPPRGGARLDESLPCGLPAFGGRLQRTCPSETPANTICACEGGIVDVPTGMSGDG